ncbi:MAG TPA: putative quinol monooxygenase [Burkholderiales bacterium]|nr:putative quinol monooxygenase [Burkholderiales bacterium]
MKRYVITVDFQLHPGRMADFMPLMLENAEKSRTVEPGCDRFDVLTFAGEADRVFLYEIYKDEAAFAAHLKMPHFIEFDAATKSMIKDRRIGKLWIENDNGR